MATGHRVTHQSPSNSINHDLHGAGEKVDQSNLFFIHQAKKVIPTSPSNARPPTAPKAQTHPPNVFIRRVKVCSSRSAKSKTDHTRCIASLQPKDALHGQSHAQRPIKSQSAHKASSTKSFLIRKKYVSNYRKKAEEPKINAEGQLQNMQQSLMKKINQNSKEIEQKFSKEADQKKTKSVQKVLVIQKSHEQKVGDLLLSTVSNVVNSIQDEKKKALALLQTKKEINYFNNTIQSHLFGQGLKRHKTKVEFVDSNKENFQEFREKYCKYEFGPSQTRNEENRMNFLRKQSKHKSNKQFDRKEKIHSACKTIRVPWNQALATPSHDPPCQKLKKTRGQYKKPCPQHKALNLDEPFFGQISTIACKVGENEANCSMPSQSLKQLCKQLEIKRIYNQH